MKNTPKISIIIPLYNVEEYVIECLSSVAQQTYTGYIECIIVDDCGTDNSLLITEQFIKDYTGSIDFSIVHHNHNRGLSASRNTGVDHATGDYIYFLDSDDYISNECIDILTRPLKIRDYDLIIGGFECFGEIYDIGTMTIQQPEIIGHEEIFRQFYVEQSIYVMAWNKLTKASLFRDYDLSFKEGQIHEDDLWTYKTTLCANSIAIQKDITLFYRMRNGSIAFDRTKNMAIRCDAYYQTLMYILRNRKTQDEHAYNKCVFRYVSCFFEYVKCDYSVNREKYFVLRKLFAYNPLKLYIKKMLPAKTVKHQLHYVLPPYLGWLYLRLKWFKNNKA